MKISAIGIAALILCFVPSSAYPHKIHPLQNKYRQDSNTILRRLSEPVHEHITQLARACHESATEISNEPLVCSSGNAPSINAAGNKHDALIRGVWWNDDPNQLLFGSNQGKFLAWMKDAERISRCGVNWRGRTASINQTYYLTYRSHYGDFQFIHAMASRDGDSAARTQQDILAWAEFTYEVATGRLDPETTMASLATPHLRELFRQQSGWSVNYLFAPRYRLSGPNYTSRMAAGSLLHMIQDSYATGHTKRDFRPTSTCKSGRVLQFHSYANQDPESHSRQDSLEALRLREFTPAQDPVNVSATLLAFIARKADWTEVEAYLRGTVFCIEESAEKASAGEFVLSEPKECR